MNFNKSTKYVLKYRNDNSNLIRYKGGKSANPHWPHNYDGLEAGDKLTLKINDVVDQHTYNTPENLKSFGLNDKEIEIIKNTSEYKVISVTEQKLVIQNENHPEITFTKTQNKDLNLRFHKEIPENETQNNNSPVIVNSNNGNNNSNSIVEQINELKNKQLEIQTKILSLEKKFENHYHIMPTSGAKEFEIKHPYYYSKVD